MATVKESGHVVNSNNINGRIGVIGRHSPEFKPTNPAIMLDVLQPMGPGVQNAVDKVVKTHLAFTNATANRREEYEDLESRATRAIFILKSSEASKVEIKQGEALLKKLKSVRISDIPDENELKAKAALNGEEPPIVKNISVSQQGFANRLGHFLEIVFFLGTVVAYKPEEAELKVENMEIFANSIKELNKKRDEAADNWATAIVERNKLMYAEETGALDLMAKVMAYVAGSIGKQSAFYMELQKYPLKKHR